MHRLAWLYTWPTASTVRPRAPGRGPVYERAGMKYCRETSSWSKSKWTILLLTRSEERRNPVTAKSPGAAAHLPGDRLQWRTGHRRGARRTEAQVRRRTQGEGHISWEPHSLQWPREALARGSGDGRATASTGRGGSGAGARGQARGPHGAHEGRPG